MPVALASAGARTLAHAPGLTAADAAEGALPV